MDTPVAQPLIEQLRRQVQRTPVTQLLMGANLLVFLAMLGAGAGLWHSSNDIQLAWGAGFGPAIKDGQWWRLGSALFLHFSIIHLAINLWALWDGGQFVERMYGHARFAGIYLAGGLTGNLISLVAHGDRAISGGASGAIFGIYGALLTFLWRERHKLHPQEFRWLFWGASGFAAATILLGLMVPGIDNAAHVGGFLGGGLASIALARPLERAGRLSRWGRLLAGSGLALSVAFLVTHIPEPSYRWSEETQTRKEIGRFLQEDVAISRTWGNILQEGKRRGASFDELAGRIDTDVTDRYTESFEHLSQLQVDPDLPSAATVESLRRYAELRRDASRAMVEGLRAKDPGQIRDALELAKRSRQLAQPESPGTAPPRR